MSDARRVHDREQREEWARDMAATVAAFYKELRRQRVPSAAAQGIAEAFTAATVDDGPPEAWQTP